MRESYYKTFKICNTSQPQQRAFRARPRAAARRLVRRAQRLSRQPSIADALHDLHALALLNLDDRRPTTPLNARLIDAPAADRRRAPHAPHAVHFILHACVARLRRELRGHAAAVGARVLPTPEPVEVAQRRGLDAVRGVQPHAVLLRRPLQLAQGESGRTRTKTTPWPPAACRRRASAEQNAAQSLPLQGVSPEQGARRRAETAGPRSRASSTCRARARPVHVRRQGRAVHGPRQLRRGAPRRPRLPRGVARSLPATRSRPACTSEHPGIWQSRDRR